MVELHISSAQSSGRMQPRPADWDYRLCIPKTVDEVMDTCVGAKRSNQVLLSREVLKDVQRRRCTASTVDEQNLDLPLSRSSTEKTSNVSASSRVARRHQEYLFLWDDESGLIIKYPLFEESQSNLCRSLVVSQGENKKEDDDVATDTRVLNWSLQVIENYLKEAVAIAKSKSMQIHE
ncbi:uncharacterized protein BBOV_IV011010 [Babesia bovis T2Bo]|uniref:uncharacterized protein n=1 Tax=Babesia bovis T2Bo TaxID=484906 RepID=UPI001D316B1F|nr:uncharacterized protein BBOV_IV011010 [Babesia bovis T2Bo]EDO07454.2 hypothetical protein BBOV_IV011010 [Babesia bovis T2Bo]